MSRIQMDDSGDDQCVLGILERGEKKRDLRMYL